MKHAPNRKHKSSRNRHNEPHVAPVVDTTIVILDLTRTGTPADPTHTETGQQVGPDVRGLEQNVAGPKLR